MLFKIVFPYNGISGVMVSMLTRSAENRGFDPQSGQTNNYKIGKCCFSTKHSLKEKEQRLVAS